MRRDVRWPFMHCTYADHILFFFTDVSYLSYSKTAQSKTDGIFRPKIRRTTKRRDQS